MEQVVVELKEAGITTIEKVIIMKRMIKDMIQADTERRIESTAKAQKTTALQAIMKTIEETEDKLPIIKTKVLIVITIAT